MDYIDFKEVLVAMSRWPLLAFGLYSYCCYSSPPVYLTIFQRMFVCSLDVDLFLLIGHICITSSDIFLTFPDHESTSYCSLVCFDILYLLDNKLTISMQKRLSYFHLIKCTILRRQDDHS